MERKVVAGGVGDLTIFSTDRKWVYKVSESAETSPGILRLMGGEGFVGGPVATVVGGEIIYKN